MNMDFKCKLPIPKMIKEEFPVSQSGALVKEKRDKELKEILEGKIRKLILVIGPCSADNEKSVLDYATRLVSLQNEVNDKIFIIPRIYTNKPRTTGGGYKGMLHQPDPSGESDLIKGIVASRKLHMRVINETGLSCADEMLYPENHRYFSDLLSYVTVGARSVENQQHRLTASGLDIPVGFKNPTSGDLSVMLNSICASRLEHDFIYRGWEVHSFGNNYSHAVLRGYVNKRGDSIPNYHYEDLSRLCELYAERNIANPGVIIDTNHSNSGKHFLEQPRIAKEVLHSCRHSAEVDSLVKGLMIESYLKDGCQSVGGGEYGRSITDPCLGWEKTEKLVLELAELY